MRVLVVGNGAREHALAWKLAQSPAVEALLVAPGNAGTAAVASNVPVSPTDVEGLVALAKREAVDLTVVGPEAPLALGLADRMAEAGLTVFGPTQKAARIESSKVFAKELMREVGVPTAPFQVFDDLERARRYVAKASRPLVVKADGLAAGKGVILADGPEEALAALERIMARREFGDAGRRVVIEERLEGREVSVFAFVDGQTVSPMVTACDYKRACDGDRGPNTGGMGSYSPPPWWTPELARQVRERILEPVIHALDRMGAPYRGVLYAGLMVTHDGPQVLEFNCRLGDPEAQAILPRLKSDLADIMMRAAQGRLGEASSGDGIAWDPRACVAVVLASGGYPGDYQTGYPIEGLDRLDEGVMVFHAGTALEGPAEDKRVVTAGGRVLTVAALGESLQEARRRAYANVERIAFEGAFYRKDIAARV